MSKVSLIKIDALNKRLLNGNDTRVCCSFLR
jgi:hypothetical protein